MRIVFHDLSEGEYLLKMTVEANSDTALTLFGNHRHFLFHSCDFVAGESKNFRFAVCLRNADFQKQDNYRDDSYELFIDGDVKISVSMEKANLPVVYTLGDSTVCNQHHHGEGPMHRCGGWGQALPMFLKDKYAVSNHAEQGTHTSDCLSCHIHPVLNKLRPGDMVMCQFGHNDQKNSWLDAFGGYFENLIKIGNAVKEKGAEFVICTPINRLIYVDGKINTYLDSWRDAAKKAADVLDVKCIDLHTFTTDTYLSMGDDAETLFYHSPQLDRTHPNDFGAIKIAEFVAHNLLEGGKI